ncbi:hypothetical protein GCM10007298_38270 [Williamsia phyllosphaerae]|uniref:DUF397 domain-containing protein n=1 Tax=Williamsia phyllosphaerae TaxID=885042 RepID=A0ABQ1V7B9_9NOCA|nr:hypothetical protein GCM10007298_38270 [Williamsia phyllosphaerae]
MNSSPWKVFGPRPLHCWEDNDDSTATCMLFDAHDGPHHFVPDADISVSFAPADEADA